MESKEQRYRELVRMRKQCHRPECARLINQADIDGGIYDQDQIGSWSLWQGDLNARIMVVGQDWGSVDSFRELQGYPTSGKGISTTNKTLLTLLRSIGIHITECRRDHVGGPLFFTNSALCIKPGNWSDKLSQACVNACSGCFLRPLIHIVEPEVVITLSQPAYLGVRTAFGLRTPAKLAEVVDWPEGIRLDGRTTLFPMFHCGGLGLANRDLESQKRDWQKVRRFMATLPASMHAGEHGIADKSAFSLARRRVAHSSARAVKRNDATAPSGQFTGARDGCRMLVTEKGATGMCDLCDSRTLLRENWEVIHHVYDGFVEYAESGLRNLTLPQRHFEVLNRVVQRKPLQGRDRKDDSLRNAIGNWLWTEEYGAWRNANRDHPYKANNRELWQDFLRRSRDYSLNKALQEAGRYRR